MTSRPKILVDHSLGTKSIPQFFRDAGFEVTTIEELFGRPCVSDVEWIPEAARLDMVVVHKDSKIRYKPAERQAVRESRMRMLCLTNGNLRTREQVECFSENL